VQWIINPYDEWYALVRAIELKEKDASVQLHLVSVGGADYDPVIRKALALGGDEAIRINAVSDDSYYIAAQIAAIAKKEVTTLFLPVRKPLIIIALRWGNACELLDMPFISLAVKVEVNTSIATLPGK
jgi:electron transfer flavoprotein beta subunit